MNNKRDLITILFNQYKENELYKQRFINVIINKFNNDFKFSFINDGILINLDNTNDEIINYMYDLLTDENKLID